VLGPDLVRARRRGEALELQKFPAKDKARALSIAEDLLALINSAEGASYDEVLEALGAVDRDSREEKLWSGLKKLLLDDAEFGAPAAIEPIGFRRALFARASAVRRTLEAGARIDRPALLAELAREHQIDPALAEDALFSDLKGAARMTRLPRIGAAELVERYELAQLQGVLLRAVSLVVDVRCSSAEGYRQLFHKLKFRQLLYRLSELPDGRFRLEIDGPFSVLEATTKYGLQLALLVPALYACDEVELAARVRWGKERKALSFSATLKKRDSRTLAATELRQELEGLVAAVAKRGSGFSVGPAESLLALPGVGLIVPDLVFRSPHRPPVYLELLGYWSRPAVWQRIEWAEADRERRVLFVVSSRLRVSEEMLDENQSSALYVFKGSLNPRAILERIEALATR